MAEPPKRARARPAAEHTTGPQRLLFAGADKPPRAPKARPKRREPPGRASADDARRVLHEAAELVEAVSREATGTLRELLESAAQNVREHAEIVRDVDVGRLAVGVACPECGAWVRATRPTCPDPSCSWRRP